MVKEGPCCHCGVPSTPLWRNGPPDKPVLCNACGSRWRTKGSLANYIPLHSRAEVDDHENQRVSRVQQTISPKKRDGKLHKRKLSYESPVFGSNVSKYNQGFHESVDEDTNNRSSSGSAVSNSESCAQFSADASDDFTEPVQSTLWERQLPSIKRACISRKEPSPVEKLTQDLCAILRKQQSSNLSESSEEELLFDSDVPMVSVEIGHGSVLIKHPSSLLREEESEASSLSLENKPFALSEAYSHSAPLFGCTDFKGGSVQHHGGDNCKNLSSQMMQQQQAKRDKSIHDRNRMQILWNRNSPLCHIDLNDVINFEVLLGHLTTGEQQQLLKHLPFSDTSQLPGSLSNMFDSSLFKENLSSFQQLLSEGVFSSSSSLGVDAEDIKTLKMLAATNLTKASWLELYNKLKGSKFFHDAGKNKAALTEKFDLSKNLGSTKRSVEELNQDMTNSRTTIKIPRRVVMKTGPAAMETANSIDLSFSPRSLVALPTEDHCLMLESHQFAGDEDLLLNVPSNGFFPLAELLPVSSFIPTYQTSAKRSSTKPPW